MHTDELERIKAASSAELHVAIAERQGQIESLKEQQRAQMDESVRATRTQKASHPTAAGRTRLALSFARTVCHRVHRKPCAISYTRRPPLLSVKF